MKKSMEMHGLSYDRLYKIWASMKERCFNKNNAGYDRYGGRGITVCDEWINVFMSFYNYMISLPNYGIPGMSIDRIDNDGNYEPGNIRWATQLSQVRKRGISKKNSSGYIGVRLSRKATRYKWKAYITVNEELIDLGYHLTKKHAVIRRNNYILTMGLDDYIIQKID